MGAFGVSARDMFTERVWTDVDEIKNHLEIVSQLDDAFVPVLNKIRELDPNIKQLPSIGVCLNNKIVEIFHVFQKKGVPYSHSLVCRTVFSYFIDLAHQAQKELALYVRSNEGFVSMVKRMSGRTTGFQYLDSYRAICGMIYNFSLEKDVCDVIDASVDKKLNQPWYRGGINREVEFYNKELDRLGIVDGIAMRPETRMFEKEYIDQEQLNILEQTIQEQISDLSQQ